MHPLPWLPPHPDLDAALAEARAAPPGPARLARLAGLAGHRRDFLATERLDRLVRRDLAAADGRALGALGFAPARLALLGAHTLDHLVPAIRVAALQRRLALQVHLSPYGQYRQALLADDPALAAFAPHFVLIAPDLHETPFACPIEAGEDEVSAAVETRLDGLRALWRAARERTGATVIQQTLLPAEPPLFGSYDALVPGSPAALTDRLNAGIRSAARAAGILVLDIAAWSARDGAPPLADPVRWHLAKQLVAPEAAPLYGDLLARLLAAARGLSRKCLVLDLDNTLWGGVAGDDGVENLRLGQGSAEGEAFLAFQRYVGRLRSRGVVLAVCSKNDPTVAEAAFRHPDMTLARGDVAAFLANWTDKATNLRAIARTLSLGLDGLVFVDDNPAERAIIRRELPEVAVPEMPDDVALYPTRLAEAGYFEAASFTRDDAARGRSYALNAERRAALDRATDLDGFLRSLAMRMTVRRIDRTDLPRVVQLINKTNQFNLTTRRYTQGEVEALLTSPAAIGLSLRLADRFGDNGLISVVIARPDAAWRPHDLVIDTWLMSCRVLGRRVEETALHVLMEAAARQGARRLIGLYVPSLRNGLVADHYPRLGFDPVRDPPPVPEGASVWQRGVGAAGAAPDLIHVEAPYGSPRSLTERQRDAPPPEHTAAPRVLEPAQ